METSGLLPTPAANEPGWKNRIPVDKNGETPTHHNQRWYDKETGRIMQKGLTQVLALTSSQEAFPASRSATPDEGRARETTAISGRKCCGSFANFARATSWQRTFADCLVSTGDWYSRECALTWKLSATKSSRLLFQLVPSARPTGGTGSGLLRTPNTNQRGTRSAEGLTKGHQLELQDQIRMLPTPMASDADKGVRSPEGHAQERARRKNGVDLPTAVGTGAVTGLRLQPDFVGWMMGYPPGWLDLEAGEMPPSKRTVTPSSRK